MSVLIPITREQNGPAWLEQQAVLDGVTYTLEILWNDRSQAWYLHVWDSEGTTPYQLGIKLVADYLLRQWSVGRQPGGWFMLVDTGTPAGQAEDPGFDDLGVRHQLHYINGSDLVRSP